MIVTLTGLSYLNDWCRWMDEGSFLMGLQRSAQSSEVEGLRTVHYSPFLHNVVLALALLLAPECMLSTDHALIASKQLVHHATEMIDTEMRKPLTTTARALMLLGTFYFHDRQRNLGWLYEGMGARTAQICMFIVLYCTGVIFSYASVGLNTDSESLVSKGYMSTRAKAHRDEVFYTIYVQDM